MKKKFVDNYGQRKKMLRKIEVSNYVMSRLSAIPSKYRPAMRGRRHNVETITPVPLFPNVSNLSSVYRVNLA